MALADDVTSANLDQCVGYFTNGGPMQWIAGGLVVVGGIIFTFTKANLASLVKSIGAALMTKKDETK